MLYFFIPLAVISPFNEFLPVTTTVGCSLIFLLHCFFFSHQKAYSIRFHFPLTQYSVIIYFWSKIAFSKWFTGLFSLFRLISNISTRRGTGRLLHFSRHVSHFKLLIALMNLAVVPTQPHSTNCLLLQIQIQNFLTILYSLAFAPGPSISHQREQITPLSSTPFTKLPKQWMAQTTVCWYNDSYFW